MQRKHTPWPALGLLVALLLSACGGGGDEPPAPASTPPVTAGPDPTPQPVPTPEPSPEPTPEPAPEPPASVPPVLTALPESTATRYTTAAGATTVQVTAGGAVLRITRHPDQLNEAIVEAGGQRLRLVVDGSAGRSLVEDSDTGTTTLYESGPKGVLMRSYDAQSRFLSGFWIDGSALYRMRADGSTEPGNLVYVRTVARPPPTAAVAMAAAGAAPRFRALAAAPDTCHGIIEQLTGAPSEYAGAVGDAFEDSEVGAAQRAGRAANFLSRLLSRAAALCPDAPDPMTDTEFQRAAWLDALRAISGGKIADAIDKYSSWQEYLAEAQERARQLQAALRSLPDSIRARFGTTQPVDDPGLEGGLLSSPAAELAARTTALPRTAVYINGSLGCSDVRSSGNGFALSNRCSVPIKLGYCFTPSGSTACALSSVAELAVGGSSFTVAVPGNYIWYGACQASHQGHAVSISDGPNNTYYCAYWSNG